MKKFTSTLVVMTVLLVGCNDSSQSSDSKMANPAQVQAATPQAQPAVRPKRVIRNYGDKEAELGKVCNYLDSKDLLKDDGSFGIRLVWWESTSGRFSDTSDETQQSTLKGNCTPGQVQITLEAMDEQVGSFMLTQSRSAAHVFSADSNAPASKDEMETSIVVTTDGPGGNEAPEDITAESRLSDLHVDISRDTILLQYNLRGTEKRENMEGIPSAAFNYQVNTELTLPSADGQEKGSTKISMKSMSSDQSDEPDFDISLQGQ